MSSDCPRPADSSGHRATLLASDLPLPRPDRPTTSNTLTSLESFKQSLIRAQYLARHHSRGLTASVLALLGGCAAAAFAIAPLAPDAALLPQRLVSESVIVDHLDAQLESLAAHTFELSRGDLTRAGDTARSLLERLGVADSAAVSFLRSDATARSLLEGRGGKMVQLRADASGRLLELVARYPAQRTEQQGTHFTRLTLARDGSAWRASEQAVPLQGQVRLARGTIRSSLFAASDEARIPDAIAVQMAELFSAEIDMHRELRRGDTFSVVYEALTADGQAINWNQGTGRVLAAEFVNGGKVHHAVWYRDGSGRGAYFGLDGQSKTRAFLASPMEFSRVTSGFAMRLHPIAQTWRQHLGVDYAAPTGTAVRSVGNGVVDFAGRQNGYGNVVQVRHVGERATLYAHLSRIDVKAGQRVEQGQRVGAVGATGWATGPHLHFEFRVNGAHQDPLRIAKASETMSIEATSRREFTALAQGLKAQLDVADTLLGARGQNE